jgi:hypothetical protein
MAAVPLSGGGDIQMESASGTLVERTVAEGLGGRLTPICAGVTNAWSYNHSQHVFMVWWLNKHARNMYASVASYS